MLSFQKHVQVIHLFKIVFLDLNGKILDEVALLELNLLILF
jgi:hypothetical protein